MFSRQHRLAVDALLDLHSPGEAESSNHSKYSGDLQDSLKHTNGLVKEAMRKCAVRSKRHYDLRVWCDVLQDGNKVLVELVGLLGKLANKCETDPYIIINIPKKDTSVYLVQRDSGQGPKCTLHHNMLLPLVLPLIDYDKGSRLASQTSSCTRNWMRTWVTMSRLSKDGESTICFHTDITNVRRHDQHLRNTFLCIMVIEALSICKIDNTSLISYCDNSVSVKQFNYLWLVNWFIKVLYTCTKTWWILTFVLATGLGLSLT